MSESEIFKRREEQWKLIMKWTIIGALAVIMYNTGYLMPHKAAAQQPAAGPSTSDDDEWEEQIMIAEVDGVLDAQIFRDAVEAGNVNARQPASSSPVIQVETRSTLAIGRKLWEITLQAESQQLKVLSVSQRMLKTEKALLTAVVDKDTANATASATNRSPSKVAPKH